ncbi:MAG: hypothetical protein LBP59_18300 [Planctomycetaceae bacterium]|nr:hypothetical protein [Planctomycetaceae bacterium]
MLFLNNSQLKYLVNQSVFISYLNFVNRRLRQSLAYKFIAKLYLYDLHRQKI